MFAQYLMVAVLIGAVSVTGLVYVADIGDDYLADQKMLRWVEAAEQIADATRRYYVDNGAYPSAPSDLIPNYLDALPEPERDWVVDSGVTSLAKWEYVYETTSTTVYMHGTSTSKKLKGIRYAPIYRMSGPFTGTKVDWPPCYAANRIAKKYLDNDNLYVKFSGGSMVGISGSESDFLYYAPMGWGGYDPFVYARQAPIVCGFRQVTWGGSGSGQYELYFPTSF